jgi:hypothetical protein
MSVRGWYKEAFGDKKAPYASLIKLSAKSEWKLRHAIIAYARRNYKQFSREDFEDHSNVDPRTYSQMIMDFNNKDTDITARARTKERAKRNYPKQYKDKDFPKRLKVLTTIPYNQFIKDYAETTRGDDGCNQRHLIKGKAKRAYPKQYREEDFLSCMGAPFWGEKTYQDLVRDHKEEDDPKEKYNIRERAKKYFPDKYRDKDFPLKHPTYVCRDHSQTSLEELISRHNNSEDRNERALLRNAARGKPGFDITQFKLRRTNWDWFWKGQWLTMTYQEKVYFRNNCGEYAHYFRKEIEIRLRDDPEYNRDDFPRVESLDSFVARDMGLKGYAHVEDESDIYI